MQNRFNLVHEPWIPIADHGLVSLSKVFQDANLRRLGGQPLEKLAVMKLLLAIAQAANTPQSMSAWQTLGFQGLMQACLDYLNEWQDRFYLYGEQPFLQMPAIAAAKIKSFGSMMSDVATGNTTILTQFNAEKPLNDAQKALLLVTQMSFAFGGKKTDNSVVLSQGYQGKTNAKGKPSSGKVGPGLAYMGLLHSFTLGENLHQSLWLNLFTHEEIEHIGIFTAGLGQAPWEHMPAGEACAQADRLKSSLMGRLVPLSRFCLLQGEGMHYSEGLLHDNYKEGIYDPSITVIPQKKEPKVLWADPEKKPWRQLTALLGFIASKASTHSTCHQLRCSLLKARQQPDLVNLHVWSAGLKISDNAGEKYVTGRDDAVESCFEFNTQDLNENWFMLFQQAMTELDQLAKILYGRVIGYFKDFKKEGAEQASRASLNFWQACEADVQTLINECDEPENMNRLRRGYANKVFQIYDRLCANTTAKQMNAWAKNRPNLSQYLHKEPL